jgi:hypothetical protein
MQSPEAGRRHWRHRQKCRRRRHDVADVDADAESNTPILGYPGGAVSHRRLHLDRAAHSIHHAGELQQQPVAGGLHDTPTVCADGGSTTSCRMVFNAASVPLSFRPINRE